MKVNHTMHKYDSLDYLKFAASFFVTAIHINPLGYKYDHLLFPWLRIAVPLFFMMSSFLFFEKIENCSNETERRRILSKYIIRNLKLYAFWFVALLPVTLRMRNYFAKGFTAGLKKMLMSFLISSTYKGSWYIMASIWACVIVYCFRGKIGTRILLLISIVLYLFCCLFSIYKIPAMEIPVLKMIRGWYPKYPATSIPAAIIWFVLGKIMAVNKEKWNTDAFHPEIAMIPALFLLGFEGQLVYTKKWLTSRNDCYFSLLLACPLIFMTFCKWKPKKNYAARWRSFTVVLYCLHPSLVYIVKGVLKERLGVRMTLEYSMAAYFGITALCFVTCCVMSVLSKRVRILRWGM